MFFFFLVFVILSYFWKYFFLSVLSFVFLCLYVLTPRTILNISGFFSLYRVILRILCCLLQLFFFPYLLFPWQQRQDSKIITKNNNNLRKKWCRPKKIIINLVISLFSSPLFLWSDGQTQWHLTDFFPDRHTNLTVYIMLFHAALFLWKRVCSRQGHGHAQCMCKQRKSLFVDWCEQFHQEHGYIGGLLGCSLSRSCWKRP